MQDWRSRLQQTGPLWLSWTLAGLIGLDCATALQSTTRRQPAALPGAAASPPATRRAALDLQMITGAHLFGVWVPDSSRDPSAVLQTTANLQLHGTFANADPRQGMAIIDADNVEKLYKIGDQTDGGALDSVYSDHVLLKRAGRIESLSLPHGAGSMRDTSRQDDSTVHGDHEVRHLAEMMIAEPSFDEDSQKLLGFGIRPIPPNTRFLRAGLRPGDLITAINGSPLENQDRQHGQEVMDKALAASNASVSLLRIGRRVEVSIDLSQ